MACYTPIPAYWQQLQSYKVQNQNAWRKFHKSKPIKQNGLFKKVQFTKLGSHNIMLPCSKCIGCKLDRCTAWALRCTHEAQLYESNYFITLTFEKSPVTCDVAYFQKFMRKLRKWCARNDKPSPRYFHSTEYGSKKLRPHHHAIIFNLELPDLKLFKYKKTGSLYTSDVLEKLWGHGFVTVGSVTHDSIAYVAAYTLAKDNTKLHVIDGEILQPEKMTCSRNPSIGLKYFIDKQLDFAKGAGFLWTSKGKMAPIPRAYMKYLEKKHLDIFDHIKLCREARAWERKKLAGDITPEAMARNLRASLKRQEKYKRELDQLFTPEALSRSIKQFRLSNLKGVTHEEVIYG